MNVSGAMSMAWMRMPGQTWSAAAAAFLGMWMAMMPVMMLPVLLPRLWCYRRILRNTATASAGPLTALMAVGYFVVWAALGMVVYPLGVGLAALQMQQPMLARNVPLAGGVVILIMGALQCSRWKARRLVCCRQELRVSGALRDGVHFGLQCALCCANLMLISLVLGVMNLYAMGAVATAIAIERLAPTCRLVAWAIGGIVIATGLGLIVRTSQLI
jgi:predicted metal-binding membrane protein